MSMTMEEIESTIEENDVVIFMKGTADQPMCGFSEVAVEVMKSYDVDFETLDVLSDPELRQNVKEYSNWPTIPQVYIHGEFIGGSDIVRELHMNDELQGKIQQTAET